MMKYVPEEEEKIGSIGSLLTMEEIKLDDKMKGPDAYQRGKEIGRGGFGIVFLATRIDDQRQVVIKLNKVPYENLDDKEK